MHLNLIHFFNVSEILKHFKNVSKHYKNGTLFTLFETRFNAFRKRFIHDGVMDRTKTKSSVMRPKNSTNCSDLFFQNLSVRNWQGMGQRDVNFLTTIQLGLA